MHEGIRYPCKHCDYVATQQSHIKAHTMRKHGRRLCNKTIVKAKGKHVKVMIEKLDLSKYLKHHISQSSIESEFIEISGMDVAVTEIKIEDNIDPLSINDFDFAGMVKNETQTEYEQCTMYITSAVETEIKQEENIDDPLLIIDTESNISYTEHKNTEIKT